MHMESNQFQFEILSPRLCKESSTSKHESGWKRRHERDSRPSLPDHKRIKENESNSNFNELGNGHNSLSLKSPSSKCDADREKDVSANIGRTPSSNKKLHDRYIPNRAFMDVDFNYYQLTKAESDKNAKTESNIITLTPGQRKLNNELKTIKSGGGEEKKRLIDCRASLTPTFDRVARSSSVSEKLSSSPIHCYRDESDSVSMKSATKKTNRIISSAPSKVLDAPDIANDYYLNLLHWGSTNSLAVALGSSVFLWNAATGSIDHLLQLEEESSQVGSVQWSKDGRVLAVGTSLNTVQLWDVERKRLIREMDGHSARVSSLSWQSQSQGDIISSGGRDALIINHDARIRSHAYSYYNGHTQEVCGLAWSPSGTILASGGNDNLLCLWDPAKSASSSSGGALGTSAESYQPRLTLSQHIAAVKAVSWCPWQRNILATGGGTADRTIRIWNASNGNNLKSVDTGSQVCAIQWSDHYKELVSSHGFSDNQLTIWRYSDMSKIQELRGHTARVLHMAKSPDGNTICSASADETIRFWNIFENHGSSNSNMMLSPAKTPGKVPILQNTPGGSLSLR